MKPHWSCSRGQKKAPEKALSALPAKTPARNQTGCGETVKLLKETAAKPQEAKNREGEEFFYIHCVATQAKQNGICKIIYDLKKKMSVAVREHILSVSNSIHFP